MTDGRAHTPTVRCDACGLHVRLRADRQRMRKHGYTVPPRYSGLEPTDECEASGTDRWSRIGEDMITKFEDSITYRPARQATTERWVRDTFGEDTMAPRERAARLLEEALELAQASGVDMTAAAELVSHVFNRPPGTPLQEAGGVGVTLLAYCAAMGFSADDAEVSELRRVLDKPRDEMRARHQAKVDAGVAAPMGGTTAVHPDTLKVLQSLLLLVVEPEVPLDVLASWTAAERKEAEDWAVAEHLYASDNPVDRRPKPVRVDAWQLQHIKEQRRAALEEAPTDPLLDLRSQRLPSITLNDGLRVLIEYEGARGAKRAIEVRPSRGEGIVLTDKTPGHPGVHGQLHIQPRDSATLVVWVP